MVSTEQYEAILRRLNQLENGFNDLAVAIKRLVPLIGVQQLMSVVQTDIANTNAVLKGLEERVTAIEEEPIR